MATVKMNKIFLTLLLGILFAGALHLYAAGTNNENGDVEAVSSWIKKAALPLKSVEAGHGFKDLKRLKKILKGVRVVGLGEATHGTREFFQFKHRMLEFLVCEMGFRTFAIEASFVGCNNINKYVLHGEGDPAQALASQKFWTWDTHEVRDMITWMRAYNEKKPEDKKISFLGYDLQHLEGGIEQVEAYVGKHLPSYLDSVREAFRPVNIDPFQIAELPAAAQEEKNEILDRLLQVQGLLAFYATPLIRGSSEADYRHMLHNARIITQFYYAYSKPMMAQGEEETGAALRDLFMAENIEYILRTGNADTKIVVWAHNGHISNASWGAGYKAMGAHLKDLLGEGYYSLGFAFNQGGFQARLIDPESEQNGALIEHRVGEAPEGSVGWFLAQPGMEKYVLDFRFAPDIPEVRQWLSSAHPMRFIGAGYSEKYSANALAPTVLLDHFDGIVFIGDTTRAVPNPTGERGPYTAAKK